jgi:hypothetical protein
MHAGFSSDRAILQRGGLNVTQQWMRYLSVMPVRSSADSDGRFAIVTVTDPYTIGEWRAGMLAAVNEPAYRTGRRILIDRRASEAPTTAFVDLMIRFAAEHATEVGSARAAIVVRDITGFGMGRMTELKTHESNPTATVRVFREYAEAISWLIEA